MSEPLTGACMRLLAELADPENGPVVWVLPEDKGPAYLLVCRRLATMTYDRQKRLFKVTATPEGRERAKGPDVAKCVAELQGENFEDALVETLLKGAS